MNSSDLVKITAIIGLVVIEVVNLLTTQIDGAILTTIAGIIGGLAGYEFRRSIVEKKAEKKRR
jgi:uncharacterized membrane protein YuzA (DUF378 family)